MRLALRCSSCPADVSHFGPFRWQPTAPVLDALQPLLEGNQFAIPLASRNLLPGIYRLCVQSYVTRQQHSILHRRGITARRYLHVDDGIEPVPPPERILRGFNCDIEPGYVGQLWQRLCDGVIELGGVGGTLRRRPHGVTPEAEDPHVWPGWAAMRRGLAGAPCLTQKVWHVDHVGDIQLLESGGHGRDRLAQLQRGVYVKSGVTSSFPHRNGLQIECLEFEFLEAGRCMSLYRDALALHYQDIHSWIRGN